MKILVNMGLAGFAALALLGTLVVARPAAAAPFHRGYGAANWHRHWHHHWRHHHWHH